MHTMLPAVWNPVLDLMADHPKYQPLFAKTEYLLFYGPGGLSFAHRHYIAIMAAYRHRCRSLIALHEQEFERLATEKEKKEWLKGLHNADKKIQQLDHINCVLAHQPWQLQNVDVIKTLTSTRAGQPHWSLAELSQAVVVMAHTHALCSFLHAVGQGGASEEGDACVPAALPPLVSQAGDAHKCHAETTLAKNKENNGDEVKELLKRMRCLEQAHRSHSQEDLPRCNSTQAFIAITSGTQHDSEETGSVSSLVGVGGDSPPRDSELAVYSFEDAFSYVDFLARARGENDKTFKIHEFSWDHGFNMLNGLFDSLAPILDEKFKFTQTLTYGNMGQFINVDTTAYRTAIWNYIQGLFGIRHDDYNYADVNHLLSREMKTFVKTATCFPHRLDLPQVDGSMLRDNVMPYFQPSEKIHVDLMIAEARLQATLLYYTRALTNVDRVARPRTGVQRPLD